MEHIIPTMHIRTLLVIFGLLVSAINSFASIRFVTESGAGSMNGISWANAYPGTSLQIAIDASGSGDEVWVACGTYKPTAGADRTIAFSMKNNVVIYGSFAGTETLITQRNLLCGPCSILSGEIGGISITDNSHKVIRNQGLFLAAVIDGFIIRDGYDERAPTLTEGLGGGILNVGSGPSGQCSPTIRNCIITNNQAEFGGGIFNDGYNGGNASPYVYNCIITGNTATGGGGGIDNFGLSGAANPTIMNCLIIGNTATDAAGGIYCWGGSGGNASPIIYNTVIANNTVTSGFGGGIIADRSNSGGGAGGGSGNVLITVINSIIRDNTANTGPQWHTYESGSVSGTYSNMDTVGQFPPHVSQGSNTGNMNSDPLFLNNLSPIGSDACWMTDDDGYHLNILSLCINTGDSSGVYGPDLAFNDRIIGTNIDMGAYEYDAGPAGTEIFVDMLFRLFPNPTTEAIQIKTDEIILNVAGYNAIGQPIYLKLENDAVNVAHLDNGIYYLFISTVDGKQVVSSFIKQ